MQHVICLVLVAFLNGTRWLEAGREFPIELERAKQLAKDKIVEIQSEPIDGPVPEIEVRGQRSGVREPDPEPQPKGKAKAAPVETATPLDEIGIAGKTADLLTAAGLDTVEKLRGAVAGQENRQAVLTDLDGIGDKTAVSILAALDAAAAE